MEFEKACSEMDFILEHMHPNDIKKIPKAVRTFFKENKSVVYKVKLDETKRLQEQSLMEETKAFIKIIYAKYLSNEEAEKELIDIINEKETKDIIKENAEEKNNTSTELIVYKENVFLKTIKKIINFFKRK